MGVKFEQRASVLKQERDLVFFHCDAIRINIYRRTVSTSCSESCIALKACLHTLKGVVARLQLLIVKAR
jgi:hypothetical protein